MIHSLRGTALAETAIVSEGQCNMLSVIRKVFSQCSGHRLEFGREKIFAIQMTDKTGQRAVKN